MNRRNFKRLFINEKNTTTSSEVSSEYGTYPTALALLEKAGISEKEVFDAMGKTSVSAVREFIKQTKK